ncbi:hypothetical protein MPSEU_000098500 [Mayamaea pseudoterrestris]|nr:hypothetical protein MPSEU_000098500 [Mayamaea pseudoterrestris]
MARSRRTRSTSGGSYREMTHQMVTTSPNTLKITANAAASEETRPAACRLLSAALHWRHADSGKTVMHNMHSDISRFTVAALLLARLRQLPASEDALKMQWLTVRDEESGYTPLHSAIYNGDLKSILLILRHAAAASSREGNLMMDEDALMPPRCMFRPMEALRLFEKNIKKASDKPQLYSVLSAPDNEGFTPGQLLAALQVNDLKQCRLRCVYRPTLQLSSSQRARELSFAEQNEVDDEDADDEQNEFNVLGRHVQRLTQEEAPTNAATKNDSLYACDVFTFGRAHPCALGVGQDTVPEQVRPQRVQAFAQSRLTDGAVHVAAAAHHTLVVTKAGQLYAFGLGKSGRLGTGSERNFPLPTRVLGALSNKNVVAVAAAENHSLCVTDDGQVFSWGSNGFGQLGVASGATMVMNASAFDGGRWLPRRIDDLKGIRCVAVAAGLKHSIALSDQGELYVWGDNTAGQLALSRRGGVHKVQRVEALWSNKSTRKKVLAIAASDQTSLVLTLPAGAGIPVNSIYAWGQGNHIPAKVNFDAVSRGIHRGHPVNPVAIACAKYHNAAISSDGLVYSWGLHSEPLGTATRSASPQPQLVTGMLPENGGGKAVAVAASENHTAIITATGALYTWGATNGRDVLGHAGVRWQEEPKCVAGVHRAVGVAAAKEHTVILVGTCFPPLPEDCASSLEAIASRTIAENIDAFNILPSLIVAERTASMPLIEYCMEFIRRNLDGVLNVAQRSVLDCYVNEQLQGCCISDKEDKDDAFHPLLGDIVKLAGKVLSNVKVWVDGCETLMQSNAVLLFVNKYSQSRFEERLCTRRSNLGDDIVRADIPTPMSSPGASHRYSNHCLSLIKDMDLSTKERTEAKQLCIAREIRGIRKRLNQIEQMRFESVECLTIAQRDKISRRSQLKADLLNFEAALGLIETKLIAYTNTDLGPNKDNLSFDQTQPRGLVSEERTSESRHWQTFYCEVCQVKCPDEGSYASHVSGRKHRNKLQQVEEDDHRRTATSIMEQQMERKFAALSVLETPETAPSTTVAWNKGGRSPLPNYKLPGPPHNTPSSLISPVKLKPVSLRAIIEQESSIPALSKKSVKPSGQKLILSHTQSLGLPVGSPPSLESPPWASSDVAAEKPCPRRALALGEFVKKPTLPVKVISTKRSASWSFSTSPQAPPKPSSLGTFADIQKQQIEFKEREAKVCKSPNTKWFIEQRERAGSFKDIQQQHEQEVEKRMYIEEQFRIEKQIMEELALAKSGVNCKKKRSTKKSHGAKRASVFDAKATRVDIKSESSHGTTTP